MLHAIHCKRIVAYGSWTLCAVDYVEKHAPSEHVPSPPGGAVTDGPHRDYKLNVANIPRIGRWMSILKRESKHYHTEESGALECGVGIGRQMWLP